jgi:hypothetical protein
MPLHEANFSEGESHLWRFVERDHIVEMIKPILREGCSSLNSEGSSGIMYLSLRTTSIRACRPFSTLCTLASRDASNDHLPLPQTSGAIESIEFQYLQRE